MARAVAIIAWLWYNWIRPWEGAGTTTYLGELGFVWKHRRHGLYRMKCDRWSSLTYYSWLRDGPFGHEPMQWYLDTRPDDDDR